MSELTPAVVQLNNGLDLQTAKIVTSPGSSFDGLNYEQVYFQGQKRIDGYVRYDGTLPSAVDDFWTVQFTTDVDVDDTDAIVAYDGKLWGVVCYQTSTDEVLIAPVDDTIIPEAAGTVTVLSRAGGNSYTVLTATTSTDSGYTEDTQYSYLLLVNASLRARVEQLPGGIIGLHWFRDRLYAVADVGAVQVTSPAVDLFPGDTIQLGAYTGDVLDVQSTGTGALYYVHLPVPASMLYGEVLSVDRSTGTVVVGTASAPTTFDEAQRQAASFYEARSERQAGTEDSSYVTADYGWKFKHLGWVINYEAGNVPYGGLVAINQHRQDVGIEGPTDTTDKNGTPGTLTQKVTVTNGPTQVNGWKSFDSPDVYFLDPSDVQTTDSAYIYADAYVSWTADSATVTAPGSDMVDLTEYSPTSYIDYADF